MSLHQAINISKDLPECPTKEVNLQPPTGISCLIVGGGVGGLMTALECRRKGHSVRVVEKSPTPSTAGNYMALITFKYFKSQSKY